MASRLRFSLLSLLVFASVTAAYSQARKGPTHLVLAVTYINGRDPAFQPVPWSDPKGEGTWYGGFVRIDSFRPRTRDSLVQAVRIVPQVEGDAVRVKVFTMYGQRLMDKEVPIANYLVRVDEKISIEELKQYGVQPFELRLVRLISSTENLPTFTTNAPSISSLGVQPNDSTLPSVTFKLRNLSYKEVIAMGVNLIAGNKLRLTAIRQGDEGRNLIEAGGLYNLSLRIAQASQGGSAKFAPVSVPDQKVVITSVLFRDGTFEGDADIAARAAAYNLGRKMMLNELLPLFDAALAADESNPAVVLDQLRKRVLELKSDADLKVAEGLAGKFPGLGPQKADELKHLIDIGSSGLKTDLLKSLDSDKQNPSEPANQEPFRAMLARIRDGIKEWRDRL